MVSDSLAPNSQLLILPTAKESLGQSTNPSLPVEPEPLQLGEDVQRLELLQVEDLGVGQPELLDEVDVDGDPGVGAVGDEVHLVLVDEHPLVRPADDEEGVERDAVQGCPFALTLNETTFLRIN